MNNKAFHRYYQLTCIGVLIASFYPLVMGMRVIAEMILNGMVMKENYPKYIIPYTPICLAVIAAVLLMPAMMKQLKRFSFLGGSALAIGAFFALETLFEQKVVVGTMETVATLEDWQMFMCFVPPESLTTIYRTQTAADILIGNYSPAFKMHFYIISVVLILSILNCLYGFAKVIKDSERKRVKPLMIQSVCSLSFLGMCILACFTAFWRDGNIQVSPLSAALMIVFFVLLGVTVGVFSGSFLLEKRKLVSLWIPAIAAAVTTFLMYIGEMILLSWHLYRFGTGLIFDGIPGIVFAPMDLLVILASACITACIFAILDGGRRAHER